MLFRSFKDVINQLQKQRTAIDKAIAALEDVGDEGFGGAEAHRPPAKKATKHSVAKKTPARRALSAEARKRISDAVKRRWAATKKAAKKQAAKKTE